MNSVIKQTTVYLPDNSSRVFEGAVTFLDLAKSIGSGLAKDTLGGKVIPNPSGAAQNQALESKLVAEKGELFDLRAVIPDGSRVEIITSKSVEANEVIRHSAAHVMAQAVQELWPDVKVTIGPVVENGFYYDFDSPRQFVPEDLEKIEERIKEILKRDTPVVREVWPIQRAIETFEKMGENFKVEIIKDLAKEGSSEVSIYFQGDWFDLCRGPHVQRTGQIGAVKVLSLAGAYWRGDEKNKQLQRIYGTAFARKEDLELYLKNLEEAKKRDHRKVGKELGLFHFHPLAPASPFFTGKGTAVYNELQKFLREKYLEYGYQEVISPQIFDVDLYHRSGHYQNYRENMYFTRVDEREFSVKPMNCPGHCLLFGCERHSYRDLPIRMADFGRLHRYEKSGVVHGLNRVRTFSQDDAHIFCRPDQLQEEIRQFMAFLGEVYGLLGMKEYKVYLSTRPEKRMGSEELWDYAEGVLVKALESMNLSYHLNAGDGAFYGPKLDVMFVDALQRVWQLGTLQVDTNMPEAFDLKFVGEDNKDHRPVMLHRAILGSFERFIGVYLEHVAGALPAWLSPVQVEIMTVTDRQLAFAEELLAKLKEAKIRVHLDNRNEKLGFKIREAQLLKTPYMVILGDKETESRLVSVRLRTGETLESMEVKDFIDRLTAQVRERRFDVRL